MENEIWKNLSLGDLPNEEWRDVVGYEGSYKVSNMGRVKSLPIERFKKRERILKQFITGNGYLTVKIFNDIKTKSIRVHKLVAECFLPYEEGKDEINHIDENKFNNMLSNLERCTRSYNVNYGGRNISVAYKLRNRKDQSLVVLQIDENGKVIRQFRSAADTGRFYKCFPSSISKVCRGEKKQYKGMFFKYKDINYGKEK